MELFGKEYPHERKPKANELAVILDVFGPEAIPGISCILNDVVQLYPFRHWSRPSKMYEQESFLTIGASIEHEGYFYHLAEDHSIFLFHNFSMFPDLERMRKEKSSMEV